MTLSEAMVIARKRGRAVKRRFWYSRRLVIAWDDVWCCEQKWKDSGRFEWSTPAPWQPDLNEMLATDWVTCRP